MRVEKVQNPANQLIRWTLDNVPGVDLAATDSYGANAVHCALRQPYSRPLSNTH